jgi:hypothetical protein
MAVESPHIQTDIIEATEFPDLVSRYAVRGVPKTVLNDRLFFEGAVPEANLLAAIVDAAGKVAREEGT